MITRTLKTAISYIRDATENIHVENNYWPSEETLEKWHATRDEANRVSISYDSLYRIVNNTCHYLMTKFLNKEHRKIKSQSYSRFQPLIAICIPEGPYLSIAVLAVHALNATVFSLKDTSNQISSSKTHHEHQQDEHLPFNTIMMPLDPEEGKERMKHIILDAKPDIILCIKGKGMERIEQIISSMQQMNPEKATANIEKVEKEYFPIVTLLDFKDVIDEAASFFEKDGNTNGSDVSFFQSMIDVRVLLSRFQPNPIDVNQSYQLSKNIISHIVYTSGTTGMPKGCISSLASLMNYIPAKNIAHGITLEDKKLVPAHHPSNNKSTYNFKEKKIFLASALSFDPCFSDILATFYATATLVISTRLQIQLNLKNILYDLHVTHILCTPTLWSTIQISTSLSSSTLSPGSKQLPQLEVVALGGEPIPKRILSLWARRRIRSLKIDEEKSYQVEMNRIPNESEISGTMRLLATYGVTEACVYQTAGEVFYDIYNNVKSHKAEIPGQNVGFPLEGCFIQIWKEGELCSRPEFHSSPEAAINVKVDLRSQASEQGLFCPKVGEVVIFGEQVDNLSGYLNKSNLTHDKFVCDREDSKNINTRFFYKTGDRGYIHPRNGHLHILGRIGGDSMIKINGIRVEIGEIEAGLTDDIIDSLSLPEALNDVSVVTSVVVTFESIENDKEKQLIAYIVLSKKCQKEIGVTFDLKRSHLNDKHSENFIDGILCPPGPLLTFLRARCSNRIRKGCTPSFFVLISETPITSTGKCNRKVLPPLKFCQNLLQITSIYEGNGHFLSRNEPTLLQDFGGAGKAVATEIIDCLNLLKCQKSMITTRANLASLGGDSLSATLVTRALYAAHHGILNSRHLGGSKGVLEGPFNVVNLLRATTLGEYVNFLDSHGVCQRKDDHNLNKCMPKENKIQRMTSAQNLNEITNEDDILFETLLESTTMGLTSVALGLLTMGINPNHKDHGCRMGKISDRNERRKCFFSNPLHLACLNGNATLVEALIFYGCKSNSPDANGSFPIHLACSGTSKKGSKHADSVIGQDLQRTLCVKLLLSSGKIPITMKDASKQTILHTAARSGYCNLLQFIMKAWNDDNEIRAFKAWGTKFDWQDRWFRTPVHWAVLNGNVKALEILIKGGCSANPMKPREAVSSRSTSAAIESPLEICERLYGTEVGIGKQIKDILM